MNPRKRRAGLSPRLLSDVLPVILLLAALHIGQLPAARRDASNAVERSPAAARLGKRLFFDARLSGNGKVSCASCHDPAKGFQDGRALAPSLRNVAQRPPYMHAGRIASLNDAVRHSAGAPQAAIGQNERRPVPFTEQEMADLVNFMGALSGPVAGEAR